MDNIYGEAYFLELRDEAVSASTVIVPIIMGTIGPKSVVDLGCGGGHWLCAFGAQGVERLVGIDCFWVPRELRENEFVFLEKDLREPVRLKEIFDLALCLEVAEHLPHDASATLVDSICSLSDTVLFSAAGPGQGGIGHLNERPLRYWADLFAKHRFFCADVIRYLIWTESGVSWWYRQNIVLFAKQKHAVIDKFLPLLLDRLVSNSPIDLVHPDSR